MLSLSTPEAPHYALAPCPHDGACPLANGREACGFSQRLQRPRFLRKTKHSGRGEEDVGYSYLVIAKGERPKPHAGTDATMGRVGGVGREEAEKARTKVEGKSELREVEGGEFEMVSLVDTSGLHSSPAVEPAAVDEEELRREAYAWPRLVAPPMKRSGHVIMDTCHPSGESALNSTCARLMLMLHRLNPAAHIPQEPLEAGILRRAESELGRSLPSRPEGQGGPPHARSAQVDST
jgi:ribosomal protein RSM22 (predicted rRNA methylase)